MIGFTSAHPGCNGLTSTEDTVLLSGTGWGPIQWTAESMNLHAWQFAQNFASLPLGLWMGHYRRLRDRSSAQSHDQEKTTRKLRCLQRFRR